METEFELKLQASLDGELSAGEVLEVERRLEGNREGSALREELDGLRKLLGGREPTRDLPESREFFWSKIRRQIEHEERLRDRARKASAVPSGWVRWLFPAGIAATLLFLFAHPEMPASTEEARTSIELPGGFTWYDQGEDVTVIWVDSRSY